jgi:hypothetical protein
MEIFFDKVCTFWSPQPTLTCPATSLPFIRKWVRGIAIASGFFCLSETDVIQDDEAYGSKMCTGI